jgi:hypothetical protein
MILKLLRPRPDQIAWAICDKEGRVSRYVPPGNLPKRVIAAGRETEATYWFASLDKESRIVLHDPVPPQNW